MLGDYDNDGKCLKHNIMEFTGERFVPELEGWLALQHYHRYYFVITQFDLRNKIILDIACGEGYGCEILSKLSKKVYGVDLSKETIDCAKSKYTRQNLTFIVGDVTSIPIEDNSVDIVVSFETIEHHSQHIEMMREIKRVLNKEGFLIISSPDKGFYERNLPDSRNEFHVKELYKDEFQALINKYFRYTQFFIQNNITGSFIATESNDFKYSPPIQIEKSKGESQLIEPRFNLCISSDIEFPVTSAISLCTPSFYYDVYSRINELESEISKQKKFIDKITSSFLGRIYNFILLSMRTIKRSLIKWLLR